MFKTKFFRKIKKISTEKTRVVLTSTLVAGGIILIRSFGFLQTLEFTALDQLFRLRPEESKDKYVTIVEITEQDLQRLQKWPMSDETLAKILNKINALKPAAIGLDIFRDLPVPPGNTDLINTMKSIPNFIAIELLDGETITISAPSILDKSKQVGFNNVPVDRDGKVRRSLLYWYVGEDPHESLSLKLALLYLEKKHNITNKSTENNLQLGQTKFNFLHPNDGGYVNIDVNYSIFINFRPHNNFEKVTISDILDGKVKPELIRDRIVLIGTTAPSVKDLFYNPYNGGFIPKEEPIPGVENHANFVSYLLSSTLDNRQTIKTWNEPVEYIWILFWSVIGASLAWQLKSSQIKSAISLIIAINLLTGTCYILFLYGWWIPSIPALFSLLISTTVINSYFAHLQEEFKKSKEFLQTIINTIADPVFVMNNSNHYIIVNQAYSELIGYEIDDVINKSDYEIFKPEEADIFLYQNQRVMLSGKAVENEEQFTDKRGNNHIIATKRSLHKDTAGNIFLVGVIRDITERKRIQQQLEETAENLKVYNTELETAKDKMRYLAYHDQLTGLPNRKSFYERLTEAMEKSQNEHHQLVGLLFLDLDGFKDVNDTLGHEKGDMLLVTFAQRLTGSLRGSDVVCRLAGDEFMIILPKIPKAQDANIVAEKVLNTLNEPFMLGGNMVTVTASVGISIYPLDAQEMDELIKYADTAMYRAKQGGKNRAEFYQQIEI
jgi:diguanylate cyclase (GGDEF)-like protein/PAS domain S-box-containing protein